MSITRVCRVSDVECSRGCAAGPCWREQRFAENESRRAALSTQPAAPPAPAVKLPPTEGLAIRMDWGVAQHQQHISSVALGCAVNDEFLVSEYAKKMYRDMKAAHGITVPAPRNDAATGQIKKEGES